MRAMLSAVSGSSSISRTRIRPLPSSFHIVNEHYQQDRGCYQDSRPTRLKLPQGQTLENRWIGRHPTGPLRNTFQARTEDPGGGHNIFPWKFNRMADRLPASPD